MKTRMLSLTTITLAAATAGLLLIAGRIQGQANGDSNANATTAETNAVAADGAPNTPPPVPVVTDQLGGGRAEGAIPNAPSPVFAGQFVSTNVPAPAGVKLSRSAADIARFAQSGIGEDVMLAYVANVNSQFSLGSDQIVYLNDLGVSGNVVKAMIERDAALDAAAKAYAATLTPPPFNPNPPAPTDNGNYSTPDDATPLPPPYDPNAYVPTDDAEYFYSSLAPYGNWTYLAGVGMCWQPVVVIGNHDWRPYCDRGRWIYSDCGWYWQSDYSWGWAAFHYGRWFEDSRHGWVWCPDRVWGPAWVNWRSSGDYCGWAALPPSARFVPGTGFVFRNRAVAAGFEFGLRARNYTYIPIARMTDYTPGRYAAAHWQEQDIHDHTHVVTQVTEHNHHVVSQGVDPRAVAAATSTEIRRAEIRETPNDGHRPVMSDHLSKSGGGLVIFRPQLPTPTHRTIGGAVPASQPMHNNNGPRTSTTSAPAQAATPAVKQNEDLAARLKALQQQAVVHQQALEQQRLAAAASATTTENYPAGSLIMHGNGNANQMQRQTGTTGYAASSETPGWQPASPQRSYGGYTVENGVARRVQAQPTAQNSQNGQTSYVMPGRFSAAQRMSGNSATYSVVSSSPQLNSHAQQVSDAANSYSVQGRFSVAQQLNNAPVENRGAGEAWHNNAHAQQIMEAASHSSHAESRPETHSEPQHFESHSESHASYSAPAAHSSAPASSGNNSSGNNSGKR